jgi:hypothetical protein
MLNSLLAPTDDLEAMDDYELVSLPPEPTPQSIPNVSTVKYVAPGSLADLLGLADLDRQIATTLQKHQVPKGDPIAEVLTIVGTLQAVLGQLPTYIQDILDDRAVKLEDRIVAAVRQNLRGVDGKLQQSLDRVEESKDEIDRCVEILVRQADEDSLVAKTVAAIGKAGHNNVMLEQIASIAQIVGTAGNSTQLEEIKTQLATIKTPPPQTYIQQVPKLFYAVSVSIAVVVVVAAGLTWKKVDERVAVADWVASPDGQLARQIVMANKGGLNKQCQESTRKLNAPIVVNGVNREKLCFVAIP